MSGFNSKILAETVNGAKNIIIYIILVAVITTGLTFAQICITKNISRNNYIKSVKVQKKFWGKVYIYITENKVLGIYNNKLIMEDGNIIDNSYNIINAPVIEGDISSILEKFVTKFSLINDDILLKISEIVYSPNEVDSERFSLKNLTVTCSPAPSKKA